MPSGLGSFTGATQFAKFKKKTVGTASYNAWYPYFYGDSSSDSATLETSYNYSTPSGFTTILSQTNGGIWSSSRTLAHFPSVATLTNSNRTATGGAAALVDVAMTSGKWYYEFYIGYTSYGWGIVLGAYRPSDGTQIYTRGAPGNDWGIYLSNLGTESLVDTTNWVAGDRCCCQFDFDAKTFKFYRNTTLQGTISNISL